MIANITTLEEYNHIVRHNSFVLIYFSNQQCNVCKQLKPKVQYLLQKHFPKAVMFYADNENYPEIAAQNAVFSIPTILVYFNGKETLRKNRYIGMEELKKEIERSYVFLFD